MRSFLIIILGIFAALPGAIAEDKATINWYQWASPPAYIMEGPFMGQGSSDRTVTYIQDLLPDFNHEETDTSFSRMIAAFKNKQGVCTVGLFHSDERTAYMVFSKPYVRLLPNRLIILDSNQKRFRRYIGKSGKVDLELLLQQDDLVLGIMADRVYSMEVNELLQKHSGQVPSLISPQSHYAKLLLRGRIDYTIGLPPAAAYQFQKLGATGKYITFPLEGEPDLVASHIVCSKGDIGNKAIAAINAILEQEGIYSQSQRYYDEWLDPQSRDELRTLIANEQLDNAASDK